METVATFALLVQQTPVDTHVPVLIPWSLTPIIGTALVSYYAIFMICINFYSPCSYPIHTTL